MQRGVRYVCVLILLGIRYVCVCVFMCVYVCVCMLLGICPQGQQQRIASEMRRQEAARAASGKSAVYLLY